MKKRILLCIAMLCLAFTACSKEKEKIKCEKIVLYAIEQTGDFPEYYSVDNTMPEWEDLFTSIYNCYPDDVEDFCFVHSSESKRDEEIVSIRLKSEDSAQNLINAMEKRKNARVLDDKNVFDDNVVEMVENTVIRQNGCYVFYICCENPEDIYSKCIDMLNTEE